MLKPAYLNTTNEELDRLISEGNYKYFDLSNSISYKYITLFDNECDAIQRISVDSNNNILGYFSANINLSQKRVNSVCFVKFRHNYKNSSHNKLKCEEISDNDFKQFVDELMNHKICNRVWIMAVKDNPANRTYEKFIEKYNGERFLFKNYTMLPDGKLYDVYEYWFDRSDVR